MDLFSKLSVPCNTLDNAGLKSLAWTPKLYLMYAILYTVCLPLYTPLHAKISGTILMFLIRSATKVFETAKVVAFENYATCTWLFISTCIHRYTNIFISCYNLTVGFSSIWNPNGDLCNKTDPLTALGLNYWRVSDVWKWKSIILHCSGHKQALFHWICTK